jgi:hypothetical protein
MNAISLTEKGNVAIGLATLMNKDYTVVILQPSKNKVSERDILFCLLNAGERYNANKYLYGLLPVGLVNNCFEMQSNKSFVVEDRQKIVDYINTL